jgi:hypothetical protein
MTRKADNHHERESERATPTRTDTPMTPPQNPHPSLQSTVDHARRLTEPGHAQAGTPAWVAQAHHVGDLSVLALALRG